MPKERQVAASISTKGEAIGSGDGVNGRAKEIKSKKCNLGGTSKLGEHEESGAAAKKQHKNEENPKAAAEEEYRDNMWGTIASAAFSNPTSATGECDWLTLHRRMGHVALPILQQLVKNEMVAGIRVKGEPDEVLGCPTCMQAKFTRYPFSSLEATAKAPLDEVVMDVVGPLKLGAAGAEYFLTIVDVYTRVTWVYVLSKKSDVAETVKTDWLPMVERQQDRERHCLTVARGFSLRQGVDYFLTFSPTPKMTILRVLLHVAAQRDYELHSLDFSIAFLHGSLHEEIWLRPPPGFTGTFPAGSQWSLCPPVYDLRHAPREWHDTLRTALAALGFAPSTADPSLFLCTDTLLPPFYVLVYVKNLVFAFADTEALTLVKSKLQKRHTCTDLGELRSYLGLQITINLTQSHIRTDRARRTITLT
ncbi:unnamed protein product [Closterium sp. NIES-54]